MNEINITKKDIEIDIINSSISVPINKKNILVDVIEVKSSYIKPEPPVPYSEATYFITENVLEDSSGSYTLIQNSEVNKVIAVSETINGHPVTAAHFNGVGTTGDSSSYTSPCGDFPNLYRDGNVLGAQDNLTVTMWIKNNGYNSIRQPLFLLYESGNYYGFTTIQIEQNSNYYVPGRITVQYGKFNRECRKTFDGTRQKGIWDKWTHIAFRKTGSTLRVYKNNVLEATTTDNSVGDAWSEQFRLGVCRGGWQYFVGYMHDVRLWKEDIGEEGIDYVYNELS